jgi:hypothetical protein
MFLFLSASDNFTCKNCIIATVSAKIAHQIPPEDAKSSQKKLKLIDSSLNVDKKL